MMPCLFSSPLNPLNNQNLYILRPSYDPYVVNGIVIILCIIRTVKKEVVPKIEL
jgi:hypothetical protein